MAPATNDPVAAAQSLSSPESQQAFKDAAAKMSQSINNLQNELSGLEKGLPSVQDSGALQVELANIVKLYKAITWRIKDISSNVSTHVEQLGTAQLPIIAGAMGPVSDAEIVMMLEQYQEGGKAIDQTAKQQVTDFAKVQTSLATLQKNYQTFYNTKGVQQSTEISQLTTEISNLEFQAEQVQQEILRVAKEQQGTFLSRNKWMLAIPVLNLIALVSDMVFDSQVKKQLADLRVKYEGIQNQAGQKRLALAKLQEASQLISKYKSVIDGMSNTRIKEVAKGLGIFSDVMDSANEDIVELIEYKKSGGTLPIPLCLAIFQQTSGSVYGSISQGLRDLAVGR